MEEFGLSAHRELRHLGILVMFMMSKKIGERPFSTVSSHIVPRTRLIYDINPILFLVVVNNHHWFASVTINSTI